MVRLSFLFKVFRSKDYALLPFCLFQLKYGQYPFMVGWPHSERLYHVVFCLLCHSLVFQYCTSWAYDEHIFQFHALCRAIVDEVYAVSSVGVGHPVEVFNRGIRIVCSRLFYLLRRFQRSIKCCLFRLCVNTTRSSSDQMTPRVAFPTGRYSTARQEKSSLAARGATTRWSRLLQFCGPSPITPIL